tara:strand:+ start:707 stop:1705 length:999 start_codon:yes stop_codon:yes gene_type:complete
MNKLIKNNKYSREEIYNIFKPPSLINANWKQWGIINLGKCIDEMKNDFIFFLTKGSKVKGHSFEEGITSDGILSWQTQKQNSFKTDNVKKFINHDEMLNNIYFFYREAKKENYSFLGKLKYISHDNTRENPVYFQWQILDWDIAKNKEFVFKNNSSKNEDFKFKNSLLLEPLPILSKKQGVATNEFRARKGVDYSKQEKSNKKLGLMGEKLVLRYEKKYLEENKRSDLAQKVAHHSVTLGDGLGYDILSFNLDGKKKFIEVKTTKGINKTDFFITPTELRRSKSEKEYYLYRIYNYCEETNNGNLYIKKGPLSSSFNLIPNEYKAMVMSKLI